MTIVTDSVATGSFMSGAAAGSRAGGILEVLGWLRAVSQMVVLVVHDLTSRGSSGYPRGVCPDRSRRR